MDDEKIEAACRYLNNQSVLILRHAKKRRLAEALKHTSKARGMMDVLEKLLSSEVK